MSTKKILTIVGVVVAVLIIVALLKGKKNTEVKVVIQEVSLGEITETVSAIGKVQPEMEVSISPDVAGEIIELNIKEGDSVMKGDLLIKINPELPKSTYDQRRASLAGNKASLASAKAQLARSNANYKIAKLAFNRSKKLYKDKVISSQDFENAQATFTNSEADLEVAKRSVESAQYSVESSQAVLNQAGENVRRTSVFAPVSGIVSQLNSELGERVVGTSQMAGTEMLKIANLDNMEVQVDVSENDIVRVMLSDSVDIELDAYDDRKFKGIVTEIANSASNNASMTSGSQQATNFVVKIKILRSSYLDLLEKNPYPFRPGMSASVEIITENSGEVQVLPISAITTRSKKELFEDKSKEKSKKRKGEDKGKDKDKGDKKDEKITQHVFVLDGDKVKAVQVETGIQDSENIQIIKGLEKGDKVVTLSYLAVERLLKNGSAVIVVKKEELFEFEK